MGRRSFMSHELDLFSIENTIRRAKQERAEHMAEAYAPVLRGFGGFALLAVLTPWQFVKQTLTGMFS
jgi:hypothetical protein